MTKPIDDRKAKLIGALITTPFLFLTYETYFLVEKAERGESHLCLNRGRTEANGRERAR